MTSFTTRHESAEIIAAINAYWSATVKPPHDHKAGDNKCPCCMTAQVRVATGARESQILIDEIRARQMAARHPNDPANSYRPPPPPKNVRRIT